MLTSRRRIAAAMQLRQPDRVPVMCQLALGHYFLHAGLPPHDIWFTSEGFAQALVTMQRRYRFDGILVNLPGRPPGLLDRAHRTSTPDADLLTWPDGSQTRIPCDDNPHHYPADPAVSFHAAFAGLDPDRPDLGDGVPGYTWGIYHVPWLDEKDVPGPLARPPAYFFRTLDLVRRLAGPDVSLHGEVFSPFTHLMELTGYQEALMGLRSDPARAHALLDRLTGAAVTWAVAQAEHGVDAVLISSAFAGGSFISLAMYREFVLPYERRVVDAVRRTGVPVYTHTCGRLGDRLELLAETGTQGVDTLDPPPLGDVDLADAKRRIGGRLFIKGNMDGVALFNARTQDAVLSAARACLRDGAPRGGYILSTACSVPPHVEPWKLELLVPLAESAGAYAPASGS